MDIQLKDNKYLRVKIDYRKGGMNYFSSQVEKRGYEVLFLLISKNNRTIKYSPMENKNWRYLLKETKRINRKEIESLRNKLMEIDSQILIDIWKKKDFKRIKSLLLRD